MKPTHLAVALVLLAALASSVSAQDSCRRFTISDTAPLDSIEVPALAADNAGETKWSGIATLYLADGTAVDLTVKRKLKRKRGIWKYTLKTLKKAKPKAKIRLDLGGSPETVTKLKIQYRGATKVKQKDPTKVTVSACAAPKPTTFLVGTAGGAFDAAGGLVSFYFPPGAVPADTTISVTPIAVPAGTSFVAGTAYRFEPDMSFRQPVDLTISYDDSAVTGNESDLSLAKFLEGNPPAGNQRCWPAGSVDTVNNRVTGFIRSFSVSGIVGPAPPAPPHSLVATVNQNNSVTLTWASQEVAFVVERATATDLLPPDDGDFSSIHTTDQTRYTDGIPGGTNGIYWYRVRALKNGMQSAPSSWRRVITFGAAEPMKAPDPVTATAYVNGGVRVSWSHVLPAVSYRLERKLSTQGNQMFQVVKELPGTDLFHIDPTLLVPLFTYVYRVTAINSAGVEASATTSVTAVATQYTASLSRYRAAVPPGDSGTVDVTLNWIVPPFDVTFTASVNDSRVSASFVPSATTDDSTQLSLAVDANAPRGLEVEVQLAVVGGTPGSIPVLTLTVGDPPVVPVGPVLNEVSPTTVKAYDTQQIVQLLGSGFTALSVVYIDGEKWEEIWWRDSEKIEVYLPSLSVGTHRIKVVNPEGESQERTITAN